MDSDAPNAEAAQQTRSEWSSSRPLHYVCETCLREGVLLRGLNRLVRFRPDSRALTALVICIGGVSIIPSVVFMLLGPRSPTEELLSIAVIPLFIIVLRRIIPIQGLACPGCKHIKRLTLARRTPCDWKRFLLYAEECSNCSYSLVGLGAPRCPECGESFPKEWLAFTRGSIESADKEKANSGLPS